MNVSNLLSTLIKMSVQGSVMIVAVVAFRAIFMDKLPKKTFVYLWIVTAVILLMPIQIQSPLSIFNLPDKIQPSQIEYQTIDYISTDIAEKAAVYPVSDASSDIAETVVDESEIPTAKSNPIPYIIFTIWICGASGCASWFAFSYRKWKREFSESIPCFDEFVCDQIKQFKLSRKIRVLVCEKIMSPLTYGLLRPVILLPKNMPDDETYLTCILTHEYIHIKNFDTVKKFLFALCMCIHWFNPLVWLMLILSNRDIEISCDEEVISTIGEDMKKVYSVVLIQAHESKKLALINGFSRYALKERIIAVMKYRKTSVTAVILSFVLIVGTISVFGCAKLDRDKETENQPSEWTLKGREQADEIREELDSVDNSDEDIKSDISDIADDEEQARQIEAERISEELKAKAEEAELRARELQATLEEAEQKSAQMVFEQMMQNIQYMGVMRILSVNTEEFAYPLPTQTEEDWIIGVMSGASDEDGDNQTHAGLDIPAELGTDVYASNYGTVVTAEYDYELGNHIVIDHENGISTLYAHLSEINAEVGDTVSKADVIGNVGSTGASTGPHLCFRMFIGEIEINPTIFSLTKFQ